MKTLFIALCLVALGCIAGCGYAPGYYHYGAGGSWPGSGCSSCAR